MSAVKRIGAYLSIDTDKREVRCLGYLMHLTQSEYEILKILIDAGHGMDRKSIADRLTDKMFLSECSVVVHICSLNKKAREIGADKLIKFDRKIKYFVDQSV